VERSRTELGLGLGGHLSMRPSTGCCMKLPHLCHASIQVDVENETLLRTVPPEYLCIGHRNQDRGAAAREQHRS